MNFDKLDKRKIGQLLDIYLKRRHRVRAYGDVTTLPNHTQDNKLDKIVLIDREWKALIKI
jgi:hypothetical protein